MEENLELEKQGTFLNLNDYGITEDKVIFINNLNMDDKIWQNMENDLTSAEIIGADTEFFT